MVEELATLAAVLILALAALRMVVAPMAARRRKEDLQEILELVREQREIVAECHERLDRLEAPDAR